MKSTKQYIAAFVVSLSVSAPVFAESQSTPECDLFLCIPAGFGSGCGDAKSAMKKRIRRGKPPLPSWGHCINNVWKRPNNSSNMTSNWGFAAAMAESRKCVRWSGGKEDRCIETVSVPAHYIKGTRCIKYGGDNGEWSPRGCIRTYRYVDVFSHGQSVGPTYFW